MPEISFPFPKDKSTVNIQLKPALHQELDGISTIISRVARLNKNLHVAVGIFLLLLCVLVLLKCFFYDPYVKTPLYDEPYRCAVEMGDQGATGLGPGVEALMHPYPEVCEPISGQRAREIANAFAAGIGPQAQVQKLMEFSSAYYAQIVDIHSGEGLVELLIDRYTGAAIPAPGPISSPNGSAAGIGTGDQIFDEEKARSQADRFLAGYLPGSIALEVQVFPGYYSVSFGRQGVEGLLSVNSSTGEVWVHSCNGIFIGENR